MSRPSSSKYHKPLTLYSSLIYIHISRTRFSRRTCVSIVLSLYFSLILILEEVTLKKKKPKEKPVPEEVIEEITLKPVPKEEEKAPDEVSEKVEVKKPKEKTTSEKKLR